MLFQILTILGGSIAASPLVIARKPGTAGLFSRIGRHRGYVGAAMITLGIIWLLRFVPNASVAMQTTDGLIALGLIVLNLLIGLVLGFGLFERALPADGSAKARGAALVEKLTGAQIPLGIVAMALGVVSLVV